MSFSAQPQLTLFSAMAKERSKQGPCAKQVLLFLRIYLAAQFNVLAVPFTVSQLLSASIRSSKKITGKVNPRWKRETGR